MKNNYVIPCYQLIPYTAYPDFWRNISLLWMGHTV